MKNKTGKYLKYALGEIILVMVGILLALQINTWNENRKAEVYEKTILKEIHKTLNEDLVLFNALEDRIKKKDTAINKLILARQNKITLTDEKLKYYINWSRASFVFSYNLGPYETLKSSGLDKIKNDSLRFALTNYYDVSIPRAASFIQYAEKDYEDQLKVAYNRLKEMGFYEDYFESKIEDDGNEGFYIRRKHFYDKYLTDPYFENVLFIEAGFKRVLWSDISVIIKRTAALEALLEMELETRFNTD